MKRLVIFIFCFVTIPVMAATLIIDADKQAYDYKTNTVNFSGNVNVKMDNIKVTSPKAKAVVNKQGQITDAIFTDGACAIQDNETSENQIKASIINMSLLNKQVKAKGNVISVVNESNKPIVSVKSDVQEFDVNTNIMVAQGNVLINYKDIKTSSHKAHILVDDNGNLKKLILSGSVDVKRGFHSLSANKFIFNPLTNNMVAKGSVLSKTLLENNEVLKVYSDYQKYDKKQNILITQDNVKILYKGYIATGPKAIFNPDEKKKSFNTVKFVGRSKIKEFNREIEADKIEMTLNPRGFNAQGNVRSYFNNLDGFKKK